MSVLSSRPPPLTNQEVSTLALTHFDLTNVLESDIRSLPSYYDRNYYLKGSKGGESPSEFVLKIFNPQSTTLQHLQEIIHVLKHLFSCGITCSRPVVSCTGKELVQLCSAQLLNKTKDSGTDINAAKFLVCLLVYIPGEVFDLVDKKFLTANLIAEVGELMGRIDSELMKTTFVSTVNGDGNLSHFPQITPHLSFVGDPHNKANAEKVIKAFEDHVIPKLSSFRTGTIHADVNGLNIIIRRPPGDDQYHVVGFIDFANSIHTCIIFELGISIAHIMRDNIDHVGTIIKAVELAGPLIGSYNHVLPLTADEFDSLYYLVLARCVFLAVLGAQNQKEEPSNAVFSSHNALSWRVVDELLTTPKLEVDMVWKKHIKELAT